MDTAQTALDDYAGFWADCRVFAPTELKVDLTVIVTGALTEVDSTVRAYFNELEPAQTLQTSTLISRIMALDDVTDVTLSLSENIIPNVNWMRVEWIRLGRLTVRNV